jgi:hypothetical protein
VSKQVVPSINLSISNIDHGDNGYDYKYYNIFIKSSINNNYANNNDIIIVIIMSYLLS